MTHPDVPLQQLASDNYAGICPEALAALEQVNQGHEPPYGQDRWTAEACDRFRELFETPCEVFFVFNGTAANSLALASLCQSYHSIVCHRLAHVETDECGAPEFFSNGTKVLQVGGKHGKIDPIELKRVAQSRTDVHFPKPRAVTVTQSTELGTVYGVDELLALGSMAKHLGLSLHMDGARFANALASLKVPARAITWQAGVDVLCFGGTKNGSPVGDAVVFFNRALSHEFDYRCKQAGQLASKMRFISAPWVGMLKDGAWLRHAAHANEMAALLERGIASIGTLELLMPCQANAVFVALPKAVAAELNRRGWHFYNFIGEGGARLMCSWDTKPQDVHEFIADLKESLAHS